MIATSSERIYLVASSLAFATFAILVTLQASALPFGAWLWPLALVALVLTFRVIGAFLESALFMRRLHNPAPIYAASIPRKEGMVYVGHAFEWSKDHLELFYEVERARLQAPAHSLLGNWNIHAVGKRPQPLFLPVGVLNQHKLIVGTTGSGKSRALELDVVQAIERDDAVLIVDPKGDDRLLARVEETCKRLGRELIFVGLPYPGQSACYNPVGNYVQPYEIADRIAQLMPGEGDAATFRAYAWGVVNSIVTGIRLAKDEPITLQKIKRYAFADTWSLLERVFESQFPELYDECEEQLAEWRADAALNELARWYLTQKRSGRIKADPSGDLKNLDDLDDLVKIITHPKDNYQKMVAGLWPRLSMLTCGHLAQLLSPEGDVRKLSWEDVDKKRQVCYFYLGSLLGYTTAQAVASMAVLDFISYIGKRYAYMVGGARRRFSVIVDELADVVQPPFVNLLNKSRGANVAVLMAAQSLNDIQAKLANRPEALRVLANVNLMVQMLVRDQGDAKTFSDMTGQVRVQLLEEGSHYTPALGESGLKTVASHSASFSQSRRTLITPKVPPEILQQLCIGHGFAMYNGLVYKLIIPLLNDPPPSTIERMKESGNWAGPKPEPPPEPFPLHTIAELG
jgi:conjugal transfer pilus assembly protein TraD